MLAFEIVNKYFAGDSRTNRERMLAGDYYLADDPLSADIAHRALQLCAVAYQAELHGDKAAYQAAMLELLGSFGAGAYIKPPLSVDYGENIYVGARTFINSNLTALDVGRIDIGEDCQIGPMVQLLTPIHPIEPEPRRNKLEAAKPIRLGDNVWLGGGVIVCPGVTIGANTVVGAGAVVVHDLPANVVAVGNPARISKQIP